MTVSINHLFQTTPSTDYLLCPELHEQGLSLHMDKNTGLLVGVNRANHNPEMLLICRYVNAKQLQCLSEQKRLGIKVVYFMDDDLFDPAVWTGLPWRYQWKLFRWAYSYKRQILALADEVRVSTAYLFNKYSHLQPKLVQAKTSPKTSTTQHDQAVLVCYHGTASHQAEFKWLLPIMQEVLQRGPHIHFELFGDQRINHLYKDLPRTAVLHPMTWPQYLAYTQTRQADIGLAPLTPIPFNAARGAVKCMDYARMGAVGVYSDVPAYNQEVSHDHDGLLLPNSPALWVQTILDLADNPSHRARMQSVAKAKFSCT